MIHYTLITAPVAHVPALDALLSAALQDSVSLTAPLAPNSSDANFTHKWAGWNTSAEQIAILAGLADYEPAGWPIGDGITEQQVADALASPDFLIHTVSGAEASAESLPAQCRDAVLSILDLEVREPG